MKQTKHLLATMAVLLCSLAASAHDFVVDGIYYNITSSTDFTVAVTYRGSYYSSYNEYSGAVTIPEAVIYNNNTYSVTSIGSYAFCGCESLTTITIPEGVTSIGKSAFEDCSSLTVINIPESLTSIGDYAFWVCSSLTAINIPEGVTSIGGYAFAYCSSLTAINIPEGVTSIGRQAFYNCFRLTAITIPENSKLTSIEFSAFYGCSDLTAITIPESVTSIENYAFEDCSSLTSITIPEGVTSIGSGAFGYCSKLTDIIVEEGNEVYDSRNGCNAIIETNSNTLIQGCSTTIIPESVTSIGESAFYGCSSLTSINIPEGVTSIGRDAFYRCSALTAINIPEGVTSIGSYAFCGCSSLTAITIPESVTSIGDYAFCNCSSLTAITCHAVTPPTVGKSYTFNGVDKSIPVYVPEGSVEDYKAAEYWKDFTNITALTIPTEVTITINQYGSGTYCSEYALDFSNVEGLKAYAATGYNELTGVVTLTRVMTAKAGTGLFIKGEPEKYMVPIMEKSVDNTLNMLVGTLVKTEVNSTSDDGLYANYKYTIKADEATPKFYQFTDGSTLGVGKAYLQIPMAWLPATDEAKSISLRFDEGEGTTDIENSQFTIDNSQLTYDLYGRRVDNPVKGGIYIVGGRKVVY